MWKSWRTLFAKRNVITKERFILPTVYHRGEFSIRSCLQSTNCHSPSELNQEAMNRNVTPKQYKISDKFGHLKEGPELEHFIANSSRGLNSVKERLKKRKTLDEDHPYLTREMLRGEGLSVYLDVHGCQMNINDTEVIWSILQEMGYCRTINPLEADVWLIITCSIREGAESKIWRKLRNISKKKSGRGPYRSSLKVGLLGCMAERLKEQLLETRNNGEPLVDIVVGPDAYKDLPRLLAITKNSADQTAINVLLSIDETYADVVPSRLNSDSVTGFVSIQRGCDNMCSYCIVPFTRGQERSRPVDTIVKEVEHLVKQGVKEITLLGQNVNSYRDVSSTTYTTFTESKETQNAAGFKSIYKPKLGGLRFVDLLERVSMVDPEVRIRFTSPHPKDFPDEVLMLISERSNICKHLHLPAQCGSTKVLETMRRGYTREAYLDLVCRVKELIPDVKLSGDMIVGFCGETEEDFQQTLSLMEIVEYNTLYTFAYSLREKTHAHRRLNDDVPQEKKIERLKTMNVLHRKLAEGLNRKLIGSQQLVLIEGESKRSITEYQGRSDGNIKVIFPKKVSTSEDQNFFDCFDHNINVLKPGDYCIVKICDANSQVLKGTLVCPTPLQGYFSNNSQKYIAHV